jgi:hypothetical protein
MRRITEGDPMLEDVAVPAGTSRTLDAGLDDPSAFFRGLLVAISLSLPIWSGLIWALTRVT